MPILSILLLQVFIYAAFPFYFATLPYYLRSIAFYIYLSVLYVFGGFLGSVYSLPITDTIRISGGNLNYGAFMMTIILLVMIERDLDIVRHVIRMVILVNIFKLLIYTSLDWALANTEVLNPFQTSASVFAISIPFVILGGSLIITELLIFLFVFSRAKRWIKNITLLAFLYVVFYQFILILDGILFPLLAFTTNPTLVNMIYGGVSGKIIMSMIYSVPLLLFIFLHRSRFAAYIEKPVDFTDLLKSSRQALQFELQASENRYGILVDSSPFAIAISQKEKIVFANKAAYEMLGIDDYKDLLENPLVSIIAPEHRSEQLQAILRTESKTSPIELCILRADGREIPVELFAVPINYQGQSALQLIARDIRERKAAEAASEEANRLQIALNQERELRELKLRFTSMIVHDLRNPVTSTSSAADLILRYVENRDMGKIKEKAARISKTSKQMDSLIDDLLELGQTESRLMNFSPKAQNIISFCRQVFDNFKQEKDETDHLYEFLTDNEKQILSFDAKLLERALHNLLSNAVKYSPNGGKVQMKLQQQGESFEIVVKDAGIGIPPEELEKIFQLFHRAKNALSIQGNGLGLVITKQIVEGHGGTLTVESEIGQNTSFTISLPMNSDVGQADAN
jgi:PAS domain S-box-containing protein